MGQPLEAPPIKSWEDFANANFGDLVSSPLRPFVLLRGEPKSYPRPLLPSLLRYIHANALTAKTALHIEASATKRFQGHANLYFHTLPPPHTDRIAWWILMQHYGAPTRLLDWTFSPFVAAYHAVQSEPDKDGFVWMINRAAVLARYQADEGTVPLHVANELCGREDAPAALFFPDPIIQTDRMVAQQTTFSLCPALSHGHGELIAAAFEKDNDDRYVRFTIPARLKLTFLRKLVVMNITAQALFPGADGLGRSVHERVRLASHFEAAVARAKTGRPS